MYGEACKKLLKIKQFHIEEFTCFRFTLNAYEDTDYSMTTLKTSYEFVPIFYQLQFKEKHFLMEDRVRFTVHSTGYPSESRYYSEVYYRQAGLGYPWFKHANLAYNHFHSKHKNQIEVNQLRVII